MKLVYLLFPLFPGTRCSMELAYFLFPLFPGTRYDTKYPIFMFSGTEYDTKYAMFLVFGPKCCKKVAFLYDKQEVPRNLWICCSRSRERSDSVTARLS